MGLSLFRAVTGGLKFVRALDVNGVAWATPVKVVNRPGAGELTFTFMPMSETF